MWYVGFSIKENGFCEDAPKRQLKLGCFSELLCEKVGGTEDAGLGRAGCRGGAVCRGRRSYPLREGLDVCVILEGRIRANRLNNSRYAWVHYE